MACKDVNIIEKKYPLKSENTKYGGRGNRSLNITSFIETEGYRSWEDYLNSIDIVREMNKKIS